MQAALQGRERLHGALRVMVALTGLLIHAGDPNESPGRRPFVQAVLLLFLAYSLVAYFLAVRRSRPVPASVAPWIDLAWVTLLVAVSAGTSSLFFPLYFFPILEASFGRGFRSGIVVVILAATGFAVVGFATAPRHPGPNLGAYLVSPLYLLVLGYLAAVWGAVEVRSRERLALLRDVTRLSNPRFGVDRMVGRFLESIQQFYSADSCRLVVHETRTGRRWIRATRQEPTAPSEQVMLPGNLADQLLPEPQDAAILVHVRRRPWQGREVVVERLDVEGHPLASGDTRSAEALLEALDAGAVLSVPFRYHASAIGRLHVARRESRPFDRVEAEFMRHVLEQVVPVLENLRLVDRLASDAADEERRRIARDLHDSVIQPYLGLRMGLSAARAALASGRLQEGEAQLGRLAELTEGEIETLRGYVRALRGHEGESGGGLLDAGLRRLCTRFSEATGIHVDVRVEGQPLHNDRLAAEVFQMVAEALSNVRRHTAAAQVDVRIRTADNRVLLTVSNDATPAGSAAFLPRSLAERTAALGGTLRVDRPAPGTTAVEIVIPL